MVCTKCSHGVGACPGLDPEAAGVWHMSPGTNVTMSRSVVDPGVTVTHQALEPMVKEGHGLGIGL